MQTRLTVAAAAALAVSGMAFTSALAQDGSSGSNPNQSSGQNPSGQTQANQSSQTSGQTGASASDTSRGQQSPDAKEISRVISQVTSAAVQGKFDDVLERFSSADRQR